MIFNIIFGHPRPLYDHPLLSGLIMWGSGMGPEQGCLPLSSVSAGLVLLIAKFFKSKHLPFTVLSILWAAVFTSSNLYNAWNYPSEILVGVTVCAAIALITFNIYKRVK
ncbi:phosphatase PAP2 family protein [Pedobacter suwonensis]|uniref:phosphatase PAP2 family protein n=1 Tax=Pedobacter suwonensis TaxID=332999 RepID=UPI0038102C8B